ncbi:oxidative stress defense protein [Vibrio kanaloae]|uniref:oxidative stress defense protein n=1 Tax=Vibrio kanaloae TaxID=170673 RepID=UPI0010BE9AF4|nr:oxidative stress defense protein [Vibrio kanaloae]TKE93844.1 oxidative stress defense protein [Vibrio kanaloae]TKF13056.1 oxidative stress defense protein [Vibrio kanaloae]
MKFAPKMLVTSLTLTAALSAVSFPSLANTPSFPHISTTGYGEVVATPNMATFSVRVVESTMTAEQAKKTVDKVVTGFLNKLHHAGVKEESVHSSNLYLSPQYHYPKDGKPELVGYRASRNVTVQVNDLANLNEYMDIAIGQGINQIDNIQLQVRDEAKYQEQARLEAIKDARLKAKSLASGFERELGDVWRVDYNAQPSQPVLMRSMAMDARTESNSYEDSTITIRDRVNVIYQLEE